MEGIADFLDSIIGGLDLISYSIAIGSLFWGLFILRPWVKLEALSENQPVLTQRTISLLYTGGFALVIIQLFKILLKIWLMNAILDRWPFPEFASTTQFIGGLARSLFAFIYAWYCYIYLRKHPESRYHWVTAAYLAFPLIVSGAWLVHGAGRFDNRFMLMSLTTLHQVAAAVWVGGVIQLVFLWRLVKNQRVSDRVWPIVLSHFSKLGMASVALIVVSGVVVAMQYIATWNGLFGTGYGNLLTTKIILLAIALGFAWLNRESVLAYFESGNNHALTRRTPYYIESETFVLIALLFTAASLASQPPAIDIPDLTASWNEVLNTLTPRIPRTTSPSVDAMIAGEAARTAIIGQTPSAAASAWSDYNHNISGIFVTVMSLFAMLSYHKSYSWARYWPVGFIGLGLFILLRSDAETWPDGDMGFLESMLENGEIMQHRIATLLVFMLGSLELNARISGHPDSKLPYVFPILCTVGGLMLLTHSHVGFQAKTAFLIQVGHTLIGVFALIMGIARWLELKLDQPLNRWAGFISVFAFFQVGLILMFYREPLY